MADPSAANAPRLEQWLRERFPGLGPAATGLDTRAVATLLGAALLLTLFRKYGGSGTFEHELSSEALRTHPRLSVYGDYYWFLACFTLLGLVPVLFQLPRPLRPDNLGLGLGDWRFGLKWIFILYGIMLPLVLGASRFSTFWKYYPLNDALGAEAAQWLAHGQAPPDFWWHFLLYELLYALYFIGWEYFFRGYLTFGLYARMGGLSVLVANIPFALLHAGKPLPEALGSVIAGVALGFFALKTRSFWYCFLLHVGIAWTMDACAIERKAAALLGG